MWPGFEDVFINQFRNLSCTRPAKMFYLFMTSMAGAAGKNTKKWTLMVDRKSVKPIIGLIGTTDHR